MMHLSGISGVFRAPPPYHHRAHCSIHSSMESGVCELGGGRDLGTACCSNELIACRGLLGAGAGGGGAVTAARLAGAESTIGIARRIVARAAANSARAAAKSARAAAKSARVAAKSAPMCRFSCLGVCFCWHVGGEKLKQGFSFLFGP